MALVLRHNLFDIISLLYAHFNITSEQFYTLELNLFQLQYEIKNSNAEKQIHTFNDFVTNVFL